MTDSRPSMATNSYHNQVMSATVNPVMPEPDAIDEVFAEHANEVLQRTAELARALIGAHQSAAAIVVQQDWTSVRKFFSLSEKYAQWADYNTAATGYGLHGWLLRHNQPVRLSQAELEAHPEWKNFGTEAGKHPPMRGWLAAPLVDRNGTNWGLIQLSDKYEGDFSAEDEQTFLQFVGLVAMTLEALWELRNARKATLVSITP
ncbi:MAG: GAF domain-containing protein [Chloroflexaceae bacterium]|nr:GAF domain-containing protein [Chloroflexaceae bacterium]